jgi:hypothetical protein
LLEIERMSLEPTWLDTETKAMLQQAPPEKLAPADTGVFSLVLLDKKENGPRIIRALSRIPGVAPPKAEDLARTACPVAVVHGVSLPDAMLGQFELICCDAISVFLKTEIVAAAERVYLDGLYRQFRRSDEFQHVAVTLVSVPEDNLGWRFADQFLGDADRIVRRLNSKMHRQRMMRKKARIMSHWARKIGVVLSIDDQPPRQETV